MFSKVPMTPLPSIEPLPVSCTWTTVKTGQPVEDDPVSCSKHIRLIVFCLFYLLLGMRCVVSMIIIMYDE